MSIAGFDLGVARLASFKPMAGGRGSASLSVGDSESAYLLTEYYWVDHLGNRIVDDAGNPIILASPYFGNWATDTGDLIVDDAGDNILLTDNALNQPFIANLTDSAANIIVDDLGNQIITHNI